MDPITILVTAAIFVIFGSSTETGRQLANSVLVLGRDKFTQFWSRNWPSCNVLILGEKASGKTSLGLMLTEDRPYQMVNGERVAPQPTLGLAIVADPRVILSRESVIQGAKIKHDIPGDPQQREFWLQTIEEVDPHGIIYMIKGNCDTKVMDEQIAVLANDFLTYYSSDPRKLVVLFLFLNFMDEWAKEAGMKVDLELRWQIGLKKLIEMKFPGLRHVRIGVAGTQLNPNKDAWRESKIALTQFANMLKK